MAKRTCLRPNFIARPPGIPPKKAPRSDREATQDPSSGVIVKPHVSVELAGRGFCIEAKAGDE